jgi:hypothetical protein
MIADAGEKFGNRDRGTGDRGIDSWFTSIEVRSMPMKTKTKARIDTKGGRDGGSVGPHCRRAARPHGPGGCAVQRRATRDQRRLQWVAAMMMAMTKVKTKTKTKR